MLFNKKKPKTINVDGKTIELQPKPGVGFGSLFRKKAKPPSQPQPRPQPAAAAPRPAEQTRVRVRAPPPTPSPQAQQPAQQRPPPQQPAPPYKMSAAPSPTPQPPPHPQPHPVQGPRKPQTGPPGILKKHIQKLAIKNRKLEASLKQHGIKESVEEFIQRIFIASIIVAVVVGAMLLLLLIRLGLELPAAIVLAFAAGFAINQFAFNSFLKYPARKAEASAKNIERDILFATRDMIISLRSGLPLYNAIVSISTGYGDASSEFAKIAERSQLGMSLEEAIDAVVSESKSPSFRRVMLQASASIKAGADIVAALQSIVDQLSQEHVIALRRYGQRLNAIAMFYMLFGVILPSMGIAIATILTTFISVFQVNTALLEAAIIGIIFLQVVFLQLIRGSRPVFAM